MTRAEALAEARRRWGSDARVWGNASPGHWCSVGVQIVPEPTEGPAWKCLGQALSEGAAHGWEAAFADADRRAGVELLPNGVRLTVRR